MSSEATYIPSIAFYEEGTESQVGRVDHAHPPRIGDRVWLSDSSTVRCWEVIAVVWNYTDPGSYDGLRGRLGGMVDVLVRPTTGIFDA